MVRKERGADAHGHRQAGAPVRHRQRQLVQQAFGDLPGILFNGCPGQQYREFIPAQPGCHVAATHQAAQSLAQCAQQEITGVVAVAVVDRLEVVQIDQ